MVGALHKQQHPETARRAVFLGKILCRRSSNLQSDQHQGVPGVLRFPRREGGGRCCGFERRQQQQQQTIKEQQKREKAAPQQTSQQT